MKLLTKLTISVGMALTIGATSMSAATYTVQPGDTLNGIIYNKLGFKSLKEAGIKSVPSGDINKIFVGDKIEYTKKHKKKRFVLRKNKVDLKKFCFEDNRSIHYKASERCK